MSAMTYAAPTATMAAPATYAAPAQAMAAAPVGTMSAMTYAAPAATMAAAPAAYAAAPTYAAPAAYAPLVTTYGTAPAAPAGYVTEQDLFAMIDTIWDDCDQLVHN